MVGHVSIQNLMSGLHQGPVQVEHEEVLHFCALCAVLDEAGPLHPGDYVHVAVLVVGMFNPGQVSAIELERGRTHRLSDLWFGSTGEAGG